MRNILILVSSILLLSNTIFSQNIEVGGGGVYGTGFNYRTDSFSGSGADNYESGNIGFFIKGGYGLTSQAKIGLTCLYNLPKSTEGSIADVDYRHTVGSGLADLDLNYSIFWGGFFNLYGVGGLNLHFVGYQYREDYIDNDTGEEITFKTRQSDNTIGLNIGVGAVTLIGENISMFAETKYIISYYGQFLLSVGLMFGI
jgi:hypothetical protein